MRNQRGWIEIQSAIWMGLLLSIILTSIKSYQDISTKIKEEVSYFEYEWNRIK